jgi:hypothetical protein
LAPLAQEKVRSHQPSPGVDHARISSLIVPALLLAACAGEETIAPVPKTTTETERVQLSATTTVLMSGLDAPRGLAWGPEGGLYVAEAGTQAINGPCATVAAAITATALALFSTAPAGGDDN